MKSSELITACVAVERICADIYRSLGVLFHEERRFWHELASEEENHELILTIGRKYHNVGRLSEKYIVPSYLPLIAETIREAGILKEKIGSRDITLKEALEMSLALEKATAESYLHEVMQRETDSTVLKRLQDLYYEEESQINTIKEFMKEKGFLEET
jgi:hypothetical protein